MFFEEEKTMGLQDIESVVRKYSKVSELYTDDDYQELDLSDPKLTDAIQEMDEFILEDCWVDLHYVEGICSQTFRVMFFTALQTSRCIALAVNPSSLVRSDLR